VVDDALITSVGEFLRTQQQIVMPPKQREVLSTGWLHSFASELTLPSRIGGCALALSLRRGILNAGGEHKPGMTLKKWCRTTLTEDRYHPAWVP
jgi:hypothetical protein